MSAQPKFDDGTWRFVGGALRVGDGVKIESNGRVLTLPPDWTWDEAMEFLARLEEVEALRPPLLKRLAARIVGSRCRG